MPLATARGWRATLNRVATKRTQSSLASGATTTTTTTHKYHHHYHHHRLGTHNRKVGGSPWPSKALVPLGGGRTVLGVWLRLLRLARVPATSVSVVSNAAHYAQLERALAPHVGVRLLSDGSRSNAERLGAVGDCQVLSCVFVSMCVYVYLCVSICIYMYLYVSMCVYVCLCVSLCVDESVRVFVSVCVNTSLQLCVCGVCAHDVLLRH